MEYLSPHQAEPKKIKHASKCIVFKYDDASLFVFDAANETYYRLCGFPPKD